MMWDEAREIASGILEPENVEELPLRLVEDGPGDPKAKIRTHNDEKTLFINLDALSPDRKERVLSKVAGTWEEQGGLFLPDTNNAKNLIKTSLEQGEIQSIIDFFEDYLSEDDLTLLQRCLYLRLDWESDSYINSSKIYRRRRELDDQHHSNAFVVSNLCSSGYYDEDGYLRTIFQEVDDSGELGPPDYRPVYQTILRDEPFTVYVGKGDRPHELESEIKSKVVSYQEYRITIEFVDVRAQGSENRSKLEEVVLEIQKEVNRIRYNADIDNRETIYRIFPEKTEGL